MTDDLRCEVHGCGAPARWRHNGMRPVRLLSRERLLCDDCFAELYLSLPTRPTWPRLLAWWRRRTRSRADS